jgi:FdhD protein
VNAGDDDLDPVRRVEVLRVSGARTAREFDAAATEEPLDVRLHGRSFAVIMRTPGDDRALAAGFLLSERIVRSEEDLGAVEHCRHPDQRKAHHVVDVFLTGDAASRVPAILEARREFVASSACGVCGRATIDELSRDIPPLAIEAVADLAFVQSLPSRLRETQRAFDVTGGLHGAAIFSRDGGLLSSAEDVGRHNAVDKAIGRLLLDNRLDGTAAALVVSGRVAFEIVQKAWLARIPVVVAVSAPTTLAIALAQNAGITLIGFARGDSLNIYAHPMRITGV